MIFFSRSVFTLYTCYFFPRPFLYQGIQVFEKSLALILIFQPHNTGPDLIQLQLHFRILCVVRRDFFVYSHTRDMTPFFFPFVYRILNWFGSSLAWFDNFEKIIKIANALMKKKQSFLFILCLLNYNWFSFQSYQMLLSVQFFFYQNARVYHGKLIDWSCEISCSMICNISVKQFRENFRNSKHKIMLYFLRIYNRLIF